MRVDVLVKHIEKELDAAVRRASVRVQAEIDREVARLQKLYPDFEGILVGNGMFYMQFKKGSRYDDMWWENWPKPLRSLHEALSELAYTAGTNFQVVEDSPRRGAAS